MAMSMPKGYGYSVLTHEAIIDTLWEPGPKRRGFEQAILRKFPQTTPDRLLEAHAYAYGGSIIQDVGYYPFGSKFFSDLAHYVRSGDFVEALLSEAGTPDEYAFALGALAHYGADNDGHPIAINRAVPMLYPKLREKYGDVVTYAENPTDHIRTEFGFDVLQIARGSYAPKAYHDFIGFKVSKPLMERAFEKTYGLHLKDVFGALDLALGTYRHAVSQLIPEFTKAAWAAKKDEIVKADPGATRRKFRYTLSRSSYEKEWGRSYEKPGIGARIIAFLFRIIPKVGPFRSLGFKLPTQPAELLFQKSFEATVDNTRQNLERLENGTLKLPDLDFDTGKPARFGEYSLADQTYAKLLDKIAARKNEPIAPELRANILKFYEGARLSDPTTQSELDALRAQDTVSGKK